MIELIAAKFAILQCRFDRRSRSHPSEKWKMISALSYAKTCLINNAGAVRELGYAVRMRLAQFQFPQSPCALGFRRRAGICCAGVPRRCHRIACVPCPRYKTCSVNSVNRNPSESASESASEFGIAIRNDRLPTATPIPIPNYTIAPSSHFHASPGAPRRVRDW
jgi:hypothetical protein